MQQNIEFHCCNVDLRVSWLTRLAKTRATLPSTADTWWQQSTTQRSKEVSDSASVPPSVRRGQSPSTRGRRHVKSDTVVGRIASQCPSSWQGTGLQIAAHMATTSSICMLPPQPAALLCSPPHGLTTSIEMPSDIDLALLMLFAMIFTPAMLLIQIGHTGMTNGGPRLLLPPSVQTL